MHPTIDLPSSSLTDVKTETRKHARYDKQLKRLTKAREGSGSEDVIHSLLNTEYSIPKNEELEIMAPELRNYPHKKNQYMSLAMLGSSLLLIQCNVFSMSAGKKGSVPVNGLYFENLHESRDSLNSLEVLETFVKEHGLSSAIVADSNAKLRDDQRDKHAVDCLFMLIGAVYKHYGTTTAEDFLQKKIINGLNGLSHINMKLNDAYWL